jgi:hypothetical protein
MINGGKIGLKEYNDFCKDLKAGSILYNINAMNNWGDYLLAINVDHIRFNNFNTYTVLLLGLKKEEGKYISRDFCISLTPDHRAQIPFLKYVGYSRFKLIPVLDDIKINVGLVARFSQVDLHQFAHKLSIRKPRTHKYGKDGKPIIKKTGN